MVFRAQTKSKPRKVIGKATLSQSHYARPGRVRWEGAGCGEAPAKGTAKGLTITERRLRLPARHYST